MISNSSDIITASPCWIAAWKDRFYPFGKAFRTWQMRNARRMASLGRSVSKNSLSPLAKASLASFSAAQARPFLSSPTNRKRMKFLFQRPRRSFSATLRSFSATLRSFSATLWKRAPAVNCWMRPQPTAKNSPLP